MRSHTRYLVSLPFGRAPLSFHLHIRWHVPGQRLAERALPLYPHHVLVILLCTPSLYLFHFLSSAYPPCTNPSPVIDSYPSCGLEHQRVQDPTFVDFRAKRFDDRPRCLTRLVKDPSSQRPPPRGPGPPTPSSVGCVGHVTSTEAEPNCA
jgi:hypothetical protein